MRNVLIMFSILLVLIIIASALGGSLRAKPKESFYVDVDTDANARGFVPPPPIEEVLPNVLQESEEKFESYITNGLKIEAFDNSDSFAAF